MESNRKLKMAIAFASVAALSVFFSLHYRRRRKQRSRRCACYLRADSKPQDSFRRVLADNSYSPFKHLKLEDGDSSYSHPYEAEITALLDCPQLEFTFYPDEKIPTTRDTYTWVETEQQLNELADILIKERVFAVDTEQHSLRSFLGFTALMQISTQDEDYLIDTIKLHDAMGILRPVFSETSICKVFHGADNDVLWLQRDFHIYVVNLFDTAKACDILSKPQRSLAYLLETYCGITTNKLLQREDWRQRPLPQDMVQYARTDACYLLYVARCLVGELKQKENESCFDDELHFVLEACRRSNMICFQRYMKDIEAAPGESAASSIISRHLNGQGGESDDFKAQFQDMVRRLCSWRELMARVHDESLRFVLSDQAIVALASKVPTTTTDIFDTIRQADFNTDSLSSSMPSPSPVVYSHMDGFCDLLQERIDNCNEISLVVLQKCLGQDGTCPLSVFNYSVLVNFTMRSTNKVVSRQNGTKSLKQVSRKASRELFVKKFSCKSPVYHNCRIYANDGRLLCYCDRRKLEWYLHRGLAKLVEDDPPAVMLLFEPKGRPEDEDNEFYIQRKKNICVGCGEGNHYLRYRIIPSCYRMHFPEHLKSHRSHDIVLLCVDCHEVAHAAAEKYKGKIAEEFGIPLFVRNIVDLRDDHVASEPCAMGINFEQAGISPLELRTAAMALIRHGQRMPQKRREELTQIVMRFYGGRDISNADLERALLVGMSSHERRRLEKKRGLSLKHSNGGIIPDKRQIGSTKKMMISSTVNRSKVETVDVSFSEEEQQYVNEEITDQVETEPINPGMEPEAPAHDNNNENTICYTSQNGNLQNEGLDLGDSRNDETQPTHNPKLSLLGHGPHGKQVVDHILKEYGEDGIGVFCQRWRQVFVEAINPRFLPAGWDIKHSGRRDFGEFSVYNPIKKALAEAAKS
ncbi:protein RRP6-like 3 isoform X1 [Rhodamnia argentea]|uniref:Protein RRP6-like 3 isoform X1 n=1 Tax=Rhodamnia argentea TaxID=178133 RepID=A0A8B8PZI8_9MYRT|nr:protein RRP6-like 3 isoform X1 [Rhodamnia argentea]XP_048127257.1 protein RRP6-like 3 isoform X1 [Rhodamnia argentea]XP_048127258.1 protein RRP6-like 3 isoform X1 [Rhodamnia argentea]